ncbi:hypothetical protein [Herbidospora sp. RD11066]
MQNRRTATAARAIASTLIAIGALTAGTTLLATQPVFADDVPVMTPSPLPSPSPTGGVTQDTPWD